MEDPSCRCLTYTSVETHPFDVCFKPLLPLSSAVFPPFTLSLALYRQEGRTLLRRRGALCSKIKQVNFLSDRCSGGQREEGSTPQDTDEQLAVHTHTHFEKTDESQCSAKSQISLFVTDFHIQSTHIIVNTNETK